MIKQYQLILEFLVWFLKQEKLHLFDQSKAFKSVLHLSVEF